MLLCIHLNVILLSYVGDFVCLLLIFCDKGICQRCDKLNILSSTS